MNSPFSNFLDLQYSPAPNRLPTNKNLPSLNIIATSMHIQITIDDVSSYINRVNVDQIMKLIYENNFAICK